MAKKCTHHYIWGDYLLLHTTHYQQRSFVDWWKLYHTFYVKTRCNTVTLEPTDNYPSNKYSYFTAAIIPWLNSCDTVLGQCTVNGKTSEVSHSSKHNP